jgi:iron(III) transport system permease protein
MASRGLTRWLAFAVLIGLLASIALPLLQILLLSLQDKQGRFCGLSNYLDYFRSPALTASLRHSLFVSTSSSLIAVLLGLSYAYALTRTAMPWKGFFRALALLPLFAPSLVPALALVYLFGNKGFVTTGVFGALPGLDIGLYGPTGIILGEVYHAFPQATLILVATLEHADARLYEASRALRASPLRMFFTVTVPGAKYGLLSALLVCFTLAVTDFGVPKVVGGTYEVLATDLYKHVIGQQDLVLGSTGSVVLLVPMALALALQRLTQRRQLAMVGASAVPFRPIRRRGLDAGLFVLCLLVATALLLVLATALLASLVRIWPYDLRLGLGHYVFERVGFDGLAAIWTSVRMSLYVATIGTATCFLFAYLVEKGRGSRPLRSAIYLLATVPVAVPGVVLGLAYILFFGHRANPLHGLYGTMGLLVLSGVVHFFTVGFMTATAALRSLDPELESVAASLKAPAWRTLGGVTLPLCLPALCDIALYFFVNSMVTVSAVIFLSAADLRLASVAVVILDDNGDTAPAAAMSMLIVAVSLAARIAWDLATRRIRRRALAWRSG